MAKKPSTSTSISGSRINRAAISGGAWQFRESVPEGHKLKPMKYSQIKSRILDKADSWYGGGYHGKTVDMLKDNGLKGTEKSRAAARSDSAKRAVATKQGKSAAKPSASKNPNWRSEAARKAAATRRARGTAGKS
jgi:hypothetical protein